MNTLHHLGRRLAYKPYAKMINYKCDYVGKEIDQITGLYLLKEIPHCETLGGSRPSIEEIQIICRPLSDLTKPIKQANYNDGKEFVPMQELSRVCFKERRYLRKTGLSGNGKYQLIFGRGNFILKIGDKRINAPNSIEMYNLLIQWQFHLDETDWIDVNTLETNPYEI